MIKKLINWWKERKEPTFRFVSYVGNASIATPVATANRVKPKWLRKQTGKMKFPDCPGMLDYSHAGYIITAHADIHIKANEIGTIILIEGQPVPQAFAGHLSPAQFDYKIVEGMNSPIGVEKQAWKIPLPWSIHAKKGWSAYVMPAIMHADYLDKIFIYPGIVDFDKYHHINLVLTVMKECEFTIRAGTPILQILPLHREPVTAFCGKANEQETDEHLYNMPSKMRRYYRKFLSSKKEFKMTCPYDHRGDK